MARRDRSKAVRKLVRGQQRKEHFAAGGTPDGWRGRAKVQEDERKAKARKACRGKGAVADDEG
jgi:IS5 family transposase